MSTIIPTHDLGATYAEYAIGVSRDSVRYRCEVYEAPAAKIGLVVGGIEWCVAGCTGIDTLDKPIFVKVMRKRCLYTSASDSKLALNLNDLCSKQPSTPLRTFQRDMKW